MCNHIVAHFGGKKDLPVVDMEHGRNVFAESKSRRESEFTLVQPTVIGAGVCRKTWHKKLVLSFLEASPSPSAPVSFFLWPGLVYNDGAALDVKTV